MDTETLNPSPPPPSLSPNLSRRRSSDCNSPEFEFWMVRNPSFPQPHLLSADELFVDGVLLPLHLLSLHPKPDPSEEPPRPDPEPSASEPPDRESGPSPAITDSAATTSFSASKRWRDIFRKSEKKSEENKNAEEKENKTKKKEKKKSGSGASSAELNINIWPFSRSRSAGNTSSRPKLFPGAPSTRKVNSAPCSRSNSAGESKSRKWPSSPARAGVHLGRSSPVWQVRREKGSRRETLPSRRSKVSGGGGIAKARVLNLNVPMCIGYRDHLSCRSDEKSAIGVGGGNGAADAAADNGLGSGGNIFSLRSIFTKKSVVTSQ